MTPIKYHFLCVALIAVCAGCTTTVEYQGYYLDAVHRVVDPQTFSNSPFAEMGHGWILKKSKNQFGFAPSGAKSIDSLKQGQVFDAAIGLFRSQTLNGLASATETPIGRMAFEAKNVPAQVTSASLNNEALDWLAAPSAIGLDHSYVKASQTFGSSDSLRFSYVNFDGETYDDTISVAPGFGAFTLPDTVSLSKGSRITYGHSVPNDSIAVYIDVLDSSFLVMKPDTGTIIFGPNELPPDRTYSNEVFMISFYRWRWSTRTSPNGKKIAAYSSVETEPVFLPYKP